MNGWGVLLQSWIEKGFAILQTKNLFLEESGKSNITN